MRGSVAGLSRFIRLQILIGLLFNASVSAQELAPGKITEISFPEADVPPTLFTMMTGTVAAPSLTVRLPDDYSSVERYPLLVYVPGFHGGPKGNIGNAQEIAGARGWVVASLPLFKKTVDRSEPSGGVIVSFEDYPVLAKAYRTMLGRLFELVPNIDGDKSAMVGFSNGAITIAVLVSNHDEFVLAHFKIFCLVDHGMFHLTDLHKSRTRDCRFLILAGDQEDLGRDLKLRGSQLQQDSGKLLGVDVSWRVLKETGHEFNGPQMEIVGKWLRNETIRESTDDGESTLPRQ